MMFTGTTQQQDTRFSDKEKKLMKQMKFGDCLNKRVDMSKVKLDVLRPWISKKITDILHIEDDVVAEFVYNQLEEEKFPCPKKMQINMTGFLNGPNARQFMGELWSLLLSAQESESGIPAEFIQQKKDEILKREEENNKIHQRMERSRSRERDRRLCNNNKERENLSQKEREQQLPPSTLSAIEHVRSQLSAKSSSDECNKNVTSKKVEEKQSNKSISTSSISNTEVSKRDRSRSNSNTVGVGEKEHKTAKSPQRRSVDRSRPRTSSRDRNSPQRRRHSSRENIRKSSKSPKRRSPERRRRLSRSTDKSRGRQRSRSSSVQKCRETSRTRSRWSQSRTVDKRKISPPRKAPSPHAYHRSASRSPNIQNGHSAGRPNSKCRNTRNPFSSKAVQLEKRSISRSLSRGSPIPLARKVNEKRNSRDKISGQRFSRSRSRSVKLHISPKRNSKRSVSRQTSLSLSPEPVPSSDFELRRTKNSVQRKRQYRSNRDSSVSSVEREVISSRRGESRSRGGGGMFQNRRRSPIRNDMSNRGLGSRQERSRSRRRSRSRQRSRSRNRSRSPRSSRYNRRRSPPQQQQFWNYRNNNNNNNRGGRSNQWRRSYSRDRGGGSITNNSSGGRRNSPQRRYSRERERRFSPSQQNQFRKFSSPLRRTSPSQYRDQRRSRDRQASSRERQHNSRDCRPFSPSWRGVSRERRTGGADERTCSTNTNRWDQPVRHVQKPKQRSVSITSEWDEREDDVDRRVAANRRGSHERKRSPLRSSSGNKRERSHSKSHERYKRNDVKTARLQESAGRSSVEYAGPSVKTIDLSKDEQIVDVQRKAKVQQQQHSIVEEKTKKSTSCSNVTLRQRNRYSVSLSRTPSPFLKPHEKKQTQEMQQAVVTQRKVHLKRSEMKKHQNDSESSSSDSSDDSDEDSEDEDSTDDDAEDMVQIEEKRKCRLEKEREKHKTRTNEIRKGIVAGSAKIQNVTHKGEKPIKSSQPSRSSSTRNKHKTSSSESDTDITNYDDDDDDESGDNKVYHKDTSSKVVNKMRPSSKSQCSSSNHKIQELKSTSIGRGEERKRDNISADLSDKRKHIVESSKENHCNTKRSNKYLTNMSDATVASQQQSLKKSYNCTTKKIPITNEHEGTAQAIPLHMEKSSSSSKLLVVSRKRTHSASVASGKKSRHSTSDSDDHAMKKKHKKLKKSSSNKRNSDDDSSSDSETDCNKQKKKHKKHKKHSSKKSKKHKKHKKKSKKSIESTSSSDGDDDDDDDDEDDNINRHTIGVNANTGVQKRDEKSYGKVSTTASIILGGGVNEDLEKQLRERALKSMKKID